MGFRVIYAAIAIAVLMSAPSIRADDSIVSQSFGLSDVLSVAIRQNPALKQASIEVDIANARLDATQGINDWTLNGNAGILRQRAENVSGNFTGTNKSDRANIDISVSKLLPTGGTLSLGLGSNRNDTVFAFSGDQAVAFTTNLSARFDQPLLRGRMELAENIETSRQEALKKSAQATSESAARDVLLNVVRSYWDLYFAEQSLSIRKASLALATSRLTLTQTSVDAGIVPRSALTEVEQVIAQRQEEIVLAELDIIENSIALRRAAGLEIGPEHLEVKVSDTITASSRSFDAAHIIQRAIVKSPEIHSLAAQGEQSQIDIEVTQAGLLPRLDLALSMGPQGIDTSWGSSVTEMLKVQGYTMGGSLSFEMPLENNQAKANNRAARTLLQRIQVSKRDIELQVSVAVMQAIHRVRAARKRIDISKRTILLAKANIENEKKRFDLGRATNFDVLQRQDDLKQAELRHTRALVDHIKGIAFIDSLTGNIFSVYGIRWEQ